MGRKIGVKIRIAGVGSMKVPTNSRIRLMSSRVTTLLLVSVSMALEIMAGIWV